MLWHFKVKAGKPSAIYKLSKMLNIVELKKKPIFLLQGTV